MQQQTSPLPLLPASQRYDTPPLLLPSPLLSALLLLLLLLLHVMLEVYTAVRHAQRPPAGSYKGRPEAGRALHASARCAQGAGRPRQAGKVSFRPAAFAAMLRGWVWPWVAAGWPWAPRRAGPCRLTYTVVVMIAPAIVRMT